MKNLILILLAVAGFELFAESPRIERRKPLSANVGVVSVGLDTYWKQCPGLLDDMVKKEDIFVRKLENRQVKVTRFGMSDNPIAAAKMILSAQKFAVRQLFVITAGHEFSDHGAGGAAV